VPAAPQQQPEPGQHHNQQQQQQPVSRGVVLTLRAAQPPATELTPSKRRRRDAGVGVGGWRPAPPYMEAEYVYGRSDKVRACDAMGWDGMEGGWDAGGMGCRERMPACSMSTKAALSPA
jgi:hypothetical protein